MYQTRSAVSWQRYDGMSQCLERLAHHQVQIMQGSLWEYELLENFLKLIQAKGFLLF